MMFEVKGRGVWLDVTFTEVDKYPRYVAFPVFYNASFLKHTP